MTNLDIKCECGNPKCKAELSMRKGYVHIRHPDGREEERYDYLHIDAYPHKEKQEIIELMFPPEMAREIMWWFILAYLPGPSHALRWFRKYVEKNAASLYEMISVLRRGPMP